MTLNLGIGGDQTRGQLVQGRIEREFRGIITAEVPSILREAEVTGSVIPQ